MGVQLRGHQRRAAAHPSSPAACVWEACRCGCSARTPSLPCHAPCMRFLGYCAPCDSPSASKPLLPKLGIHTHTKKEFGFPLAWRADGEVVCHHDFEVKLSLGAEVVKLAIPLLDFAQLQRWASLLFLAGGVWGCGRGLRGGGHVTFPKARRLSLGWEPSAGPAGTPWAWPGWVGLGWAGCRGGPGGGVERQRPPWGASHVRLAACQRAGWAGCRGSSQIDSQPTSCCIR